MYIKFAYCLIAILYCISVKNSMLIAKIIQI